MTQTVSFDLDTVHDRRNTHSSKWSTYDEDVLPMYVADMDFQSPPAVIETLREVVDRGFFWLYQSPRHPQTDHY